MSDRPALVGHVQMETAMPPAIALQRVSKVYGRGANQVRALDDISLDFPAGSFTAIMGPSGSGKSTMLHCAAGLDKPTSGTVLLGTTDLTRLKEPDITLLRRNRIGFVFQAFNLVPSLNVRENLELPLRLAGRRPNKAWTNAVIEQVGLADRIKHRPAELSGGQQQRVAIARALVARPEVIFADEPTGALDTRTSRTILELLRTIVDRHHQTLMMVTHDPTAASYADRVIFLADGRIVTELNRPDLMMITKQLAQVRGEE